MKKRNIDITLLQETYNITENHYYYEGFLVILASSLPTENGRSHTGVGFIIAPKSQHITGIWSLDLDYFGPEIGKEHR